MLITVHYVFLIAWLWFNEPLPANQISRNNRARQEAEMAYRAGRYEQALTLYAYLGQNTTTIDPAVRLNLGHSYFQLNRFSKAKPQYETLLQSDRADLRTVAATQLGVIACLEKDSATALNLFRQALLENANNEPARYNFELVKKRYSGKVPPTKSRRLPATQQPQPTSQLQQLGAGQVERSTRQDELLRRFERLNLSEEQALQLLDAMQRDDLPYALTQSARRPNKSAATGNRW